MATTPTITKAKWSGVTLIKDADANGTVEKDVMEGPCRLTHVAFTSSIPAEVLYLKFYDDANPVVGTTDPVLVLEIPITAPKDFPINPGVGLVFETALSFALVQEAGTAGTTDPTNTEVVVLTLLPGTS